MDGGHRLGPFAVDPGGAGLGGAVGRGDGGFLGAGIEGSHAARRAFVEQQGGGTDHRLGMEGVAQHAAIENIGDGEQGHALVVRHIGSARRRGVRLLEPAPA